MNILITTALLWVVSAVGVAPLANFWLRRRLLQPAYAHLQGAEGAELDQAAIGTLATQCYILADVLVLGVLGFVGGLLGYQFFGLSLEAKGWPGIITFMLSSYIGTTVRAGVGPAFAPIA
jgi:hypothetical protein